MSRPSVCPEQANHPTRELSLFGSRYPRQRIGVRRRIGRRGPRHLAARLATMTRQTNWCGVTSIKGSIGANARTFGRPCDGRRDLGLVPSETVLSKPARAGGVALPSWSTPPAPHGFHEVFRPEPQQRPFGALHLSSSVNNILSAGSSQDGISGTPDYSAPLRFRTSYTSYGAFSTLSRSPSVPGGLRTPLHQAPVMGPHAAPAYSFAAPR